MLEKPDALVVGMPEGESYAAVLKKLRWDPRMESLGKVVSKVKRTQLEKVHSVQASDQDQASPKMLIVQLNLNHTKAAQALLE